MPIDVNWFNDSQTAVLINYEGHWIWETFYEAIDEAMKLFDSISYPAALIIDLTNSDAMPKGSIAHIRNAQGMQHAQMSCVIFVGMDTLMQMIGNLAIRLNRGRRRTVYMVSTIDDAIQHIPAPK